MPNSKQIDISTNIDTQVQTGLIVSELKYRRLFETASDGILMLDAESGEIIVHLKKNT
jgi:hypothetical protein